VIPFNVLAVTTKKAGHSNGFRRGLRGLRGKKMIFFFRDRARTQESKY